MIHEANEVETMNFNIVELLTQTLGTHTIIVDMDKCNHLVVMQVSNLRNNESNQIVKKIIYLETRPKFALSIYYR